MGEQTLLILVGLGVLAWLLAWGWPTSKPRRVVDARPLGLDGSIRIVCPGCVERSRVLAMGVGARMTAGHLPASPMPFPGPGLRPVALGHDVEDHLECPRCHAVYAVVDAPSVSLPAPRRAVD
jgi:hypothetical protein